MSEAVLVHLGAGVGNVVLATPLLVSLNRLGLSIDLWLSADYAETSDLFRGWAAVRRFVDGLRGEYRARIPAIPPFYWPAFSREYARAEAVVPRPPDALFYTNEQDYYVAFARSLGYDGPTPAPCVPVPPSLPRGVEATLVLAPGCKTGEMAAKRWPSFPELADRFDDVVVVGTRDDLRRFDGTEMAFSSHVRVMTGRLTLRQTAELIASAGVVVANDSGLGHLAAALGTPTILLFGPTPDRTLGALPPNVTIVRTGLPCEPCWFGEPRRFQQCSGRIDCLAGISVNRVAALVGQRLPTAGWTREDVHAQHCAGART